MDTQSKEELARLYGLVESATATTNFYNQVYHYIGFIKKSDFLSKILEEDDKAWHLYDLEKLKTRPKQLAEEDDLKYFVKKMKHMRSGDSYFLSHYFSDITYRIYDLLDWHYTDGFENEEVLIMLNGASKKRKSFFNLNKPLINREDYNKIYIGNFPFWKNFIKDFHTLLMKKMENLEAPKLSPSFVLNDNGSYMYKNHTGSFTISSREYKLLKLLADNRGKIIHYYEIINKIYNKDDSSFGRMQVNTLIKKIRTGLNILPKRKGSLENVVINHRNTGYVLDI
jgi:hypothetical protein